MSSKKKLVKRTIELAMELSRNTPYSPDIDDKVINENTYKLYARRIADYKGHIWNNKEAGDRLYNEMVGVPTMYNYKRWYNMTTTEDLNEMLRSGNGHWADSFGKTWLHPTVSNESPYSGYINPYNPYGLEFGVWSSKPLKIFNGYNTAGLLDIYKPSFDLLVTVTKENPENLDKSLDEIGYNNDRLIQNNSVGYDEENLSTVAGLLPTLYVKPNKTYTKMKPNKTNTGWIYINEQ